MALIGYARVSTAEQDTQLQLLALKNAGCTQIYKEKTSSVGIRPQLQNAMRSIKDGDTLVIYKIDRLARSLSDLLSIIDNLNLRKASIKSLTEPIDTTTATGVLMLQILGAFAQFERNLIRERSIAGQQAAMAAGKHCGRRPGYTKQQYIDCQMLRLRGHSYSSIQAYTGLSISQIKRIVHGYNKKPT